MYSYIFQQWRRRSRWSTEVLKFPPGIRDCVTDSSGEDPRPLLLNTSLSSRIQWSKMVLIQWNINPTCSGKVSYLVDYTWDEYGFNKGGQIFSLHSLWQPTTEIPAQLAQLAPCLSQCASSAPSFPSSQALFQLPWKCGPCPLSPWDASVLSKLTY